MRKVGVGLGLLLLVPGLALAQDRYGEVHRTPTGHQGYFLDYYCNNPAPAGAADQIVHIMNVGTNGTPLTSPVGDICANIYVFDNNQEMVSCCAQRITPNELGSASLGQLTSNTLAWVIPPAGVIKIATTIAGTGACDPRTADLTTASTTYAVVFGTHLQVASGRTFVTETETLSSPLSTAEAGFLTQACLFVHYLGSGRGVCTSSFPGH